MYLRKSPRNSYQPVGVRSSGLVTNQLRRNSDHLQDFAVTRQQAERFVQETLGIEFSSGRVTNDLKGLLDDIVYNVHMKIPWHNVDCLANPGVFDRQPEKLLGIKELAPSVLLGKRGSGCYLLNSSLSHVLQALGINNDLTMAHGIWDKEVDAHVIPIATAANGDRILVDCGAGSPTFTAFSLGFPEDSVTETFHHSFLSYRLRRANGRIYREAKHVDNDGVETWTRQYDFSITPRSLDYIITNVCRSMLLPTNPWMGKTIRAIMFPNGRALYIKDNLLAIEDQSGVINKTILTSKEELVDALKSYFPTILEEAIETGVNNWIVFNNLDKTLNPISCAVKSTFN